MPMPDDKSKPSHLEPTAPRHSAVALALLLGLGCGADPTEPEVAGAVETSARTEVPAVVEAPLNEPASDPELTEWLEQQVVHDGHIARAALYTWTTAEQVTSLAAAAETASRITPILLTRERSASGQRSLFDERIAGDPSPLARRLRSRRHRVRRFAWPNAWATAAGWDGGEYGLQLVRVELRGSAWVAHFDPAATPTFRAFDLEGHAVPSGELAAAPERVAAVYHVAEAEDGRTFREYVLVNEAMLERVQVGGPEIAARLDEDARRLAALAVQATSDGGGELWAARLRSSWGGGPEADSLVSLYEGGLAFGSVHYRPAAETWRALSRRLEALPEPAAHIDYRPPHEFPTRPAPRRLRERRPTTRPVFIDPTLG